SRRASLIVPAIRISRMRTICMPLRTIFLQEEPRSFTASYGYRMLPIMVETSKGIKKVPGGTYMQIKTALMAVLLCCGTWVVAQDAASTSTSQTAPSSQTSTTTTQSTTTTSAPGSSQSTASSPTTGQSSSTSSDQTGSMSNQTSPTSPNSTGSAA